MNIIICINQYKVFNLGDSYCLNCGEMKIIAGPASNDIAEKIAKSLGITKLDVVFKHFYDGETYLKIDDSVTMEEIIIVQSTSPPQEKHLLELLLIASSLKNFGADKIHAVVPYLCYARADRRRRKGEVLSHQIILEILYKSGIDSLISINVHNEEMFNQFIPQLEKYSLKADHLIAKEIKKLQIDDILIVGPDKGSTENAEIIANELGAPFNFFKKYRDPETHSVTLQDTEFDCRDKNIVLVDDIITSGTTAFKAIDLLLKKKPKSIIFACIHSLSKPDVFNKMLQKGVNEIFSTNTIPRKDIKQIDISPLISKFIEEKFL